MRNVVISDDAAAQQAGAQVLAGGGNAADAVVAALLAGATRASAASLLGSALVLIAGPGVGAHVVDGRARAPGLGERRSSAPDDPPVAWRAAVPGLLEGALGTRNRFGTLGIGAIARAAASAVRDFDAADAGAIARLELLEALPRLGLDALARLGVYQSMLEIAGPAAGGVLGRDDLTASSSPVRTLLEAPAGAHQLLTAPRAATPRFAPPAAPSVAVRAALCADMHGVTACALWVVAPEAVALPGSPGLALAALCNAPTRGVTRRRPGSPLPMPTPCVLVRNEGRVWGGFAAPGAGDVEAAVTAFVRARLAVLGIALEAAERASARGTVLHVVRDAGGEVRAGAEAFDA